MTGNNVRDQMVGVVEINYGLIITIFRNEGNI